MLYILGNSKEGSNLMPRCQLSDSDIVTTLKVQYGESFYVLDLDRLRGNYDKMFSAFSSRYSNVIIGYSYKTNYVPTLLKEMAKLGAYAEVVSRLEYDLALKIGETPRRIIFNGPLKAYEDIEVALDGESILNLDSFYEIDLVRKYASENKDRDIKIGLRVSFNLTIDDYNPIQSGFKVSRFGFCVENGNLEKALVELMKIKNVKVVGFHGHFSTNTRSLRVYKKITKKLCYLSKKYLRDTLEYIDIGGGMYGEVPKTMKIKNVPTMDEYAEVICSILNKEKVHFKEDPILIIEPGLSMVADTFKFYCKVIDVKKNQNENFVLVNGSIQNVKPTMHARNLPMELLKMNQGNYKTGTFNVVGHTCMEKDYLANNIQDKIPKVGDYLVFNNVGAYTIVFNPPFIKERPPIISMDGTEFKVARKEEKLGEFINDAVYVF